MASKYARQFSLPNGFPEILKDFTREVLRSQTEDMYKFGYEYFTEQIRRRDNPQDYQEQGEESGDPNRLSGEELKLKIEQLFTEADADGNGYLDRKEFKQVFNGLQEELGLTKKDVIKIMAEADENADGVIEYQEFAPIAVDVVNSIYAKQDYEAEQEARKTDALDDAREFLLHGMPREELEAMLADVFTKADADNNGFLSRKEFSQCIKEADLGFTRKEINVLMSEVDCDQDGKVSYEEFVPLCFTLLVEMVSDSLVEAPQEEEELCEFFKDLFGASANEEGLLSHSDVLNLMKQADLGLTRVQMHAIMSEGEFDENGMTNYESIASAVSGVVIALVNVQMQQERATKVTELRQGDEHNYVFGMTREMFEQNLFQACSANDVSGSGMVSVEAVKSALCSIAPDITEKQVQAVLSPAEGASEVDMNEIVSYAFPILQWLDEQSRMNG